jgi:hypothetical protein
MIGFIGDVEREANFFAKVLQFGEGLRFSRRRIDNMEGVFNANMRIVHMKLVERFQIVNML